MPIFAGDLLTVLATDILIFALFAASLHFIMGPGGMVSFGHAAYFGLGAYGAALVVKYAGGDMTLGLLAAPVFAGLGALLFGWFCVRLSGVYLAMLTLAAAQIVWSIAFQWRDVTGGDDGMLGIWPSAWASDKIPYYYLTLALCAGGIYWLRRMVYAPFGYGLCAPCVTAPSAVLPSASISSASNGSPSSSPVFSQVSQAASTPFPKAVSSPTSSPSRARSMG